MIWRKGVHSPLGEKDNKSYCLKSSHRTALFLQHQELEISSENWLLVVRRPQIAARQEEKSIMKRLIHFLAIAALVGSIAVLSTSDVKAGRTGGSQSWVGIVPAYQSVYYDISFDAGAPAVIVASGTTTTGGLNLIVTDSVGNSWVGRSKGPQTIVRFQVVQTGNFHVVVQNPGNLPNMFVLSTN
jgi:hypothetical protein